MNLITVITHWPRSEKRASYLGHVLEALRNRLEGVPEPRIVVSILPGEHLDTSLQLCRFYRAVTTLHSDRLSGGSHLEAVRNIAFDAFNADAFLLVQDDWELRHRFNPYHYASRVLQRPQHNIALLRTCWHEQGWEQGVNFSRIQSIGAHDSPDYDILSPSSMFFYSDQPGIHFRPILHAGMYYPADDDSWEWRYNAACKEECRRGSLNIAALPHCPEQRWRHIGEESTFLSRPNQSRIPL